MNNGHTTIVEINWGKARAFTWSVLMILTWVVLLYMLVTEGLNKDTWTAVVLIFFVTLAAMRSKK